MGAGTDWEQRAKRDQEGGRESRSQSREGWGVGGGARNHVAGTPGVPPEIFQTIR